MYTDDMRHPAEPTVVQIDGSCGEGGGQVLRTSLALSCALGRAFSITNIRKARKRPGLQPQHLTAVKAAAALSGAQVTGAELFSPALEFRPGRTRGGIFAFDVAEERGSAGSAGLVLQAILLPLCLAEGRSQIVLQGGTHVPWSPSFHYLDWIVVPLLRRLGATVDLTLTSWGWYPLGSGQITARIIPSQRFRPLVLTDRGRLVRLCGISAVSNLSRHIAERQRDRAAAILGRRGLDTSIEILSAPSAGKGSFLFLAAEFEGLVEGFGALGAIGKRAEEVAEEACTAFVSHLQARGALDPYLADQLVPWLAFAEGPSEFTTSRVTSHLLTNLWVLRQFLEVLVQVEGAEGSEGLVRIRPTVHGEDRIT